MKGFRAAVGLWCIVSLACVVAASAQPGAAQHDDPKTILDRIYSVPQAERGEQRFKQSCSSCHAATDFAGGTLASRWDGQTLGDVFEYISTTMPQNDPGSLKPEDYASILAFFLRMDGYPVGVDDMPGNRDLLGKYAIVPNPK